MKVLWQKLLSNLRTNFKAQSKYCRQKHFVQLTVMSLEDRTVPNSGSITSAITVINNSGFTLTFAGENLQNSTHDLTTRPNTIANGTSANWTVGDGSGFLGLPVGVVGTVTWNIGNTGDQDTLNLDFPLVGVNSASQSLTDNSTNYFNVTQFWSGNNPTFTIAVNPATQAWASGATYRRIIRPLPLTVQ